MGLAVETIDLSLVAKERIIFEGYIQYNTMQNTGLYISNTGSHRPLVYWKVHPLGKE